MDLTAAFKQTDIGPLPSDWDVVPLGELVTRVEYGSSAKSRPKGRVPVLRMGNLQHGKIDWGDLVYTDNEEEIERYTLHDGEVLFNRTNTVDLVGKTAIYEGRRKAIFAGYLIRVVTQADRLDARYLNYVMNTEVARKHSAKVLSVAVGQANINGQKLRTYPIPVPPTLAEQQSIARALGDVDALLERLDQLIAKKRDLGEAVAQRLLTREVRLPGFDGEWDLQRLGDICDISIGRTPARRNPAFWGAGHTWLSIADMTSKVVSTSDEEITNLAAETMSVVPKGTLMMSFKLSIGRLCFAGRDLYTNEAICSFRNLKADADFLYYALGRTDFSLYGKLAVKGYTLNKESLRHVEVRLPSLAEQHAIAETISDMDSEIAALEARRAKTADLKLAMMQELLTGKTRLITTGGADG